MSAEQSALPAYYSPRISSEVDDCSLPLTFDSYSRCSLGCRYCVPSGTQITLIDGSTKAVEDVSVNEVLLGYNEDTKTVEPVVVLETMNRETQCLVTFTLESGSLQVTPEHPLYTQRGWVSAQDIVKGDYLLRHDHFAYRLDRVTVELILHRELPRDGVSLHALFPVWNAMVQRCHYSGNAKFQYYGARGIQVCPEWRDNPTEFYAWAASNGYVSGVGLEVDRVNNNGPYSPDNCRVVSHKENSNNRRRPSHGALQYSGIRKVGNRYHTCPSVEGATPQSFTTVEQAAIMHDREIRGIRTSLNFPTVLDAESAIHWDKVLYKRNKIYTENLKTVYNFECWPNNNYFAHAPTHYKKSNNIGYLSHNCFSNTQKGNNPVLKKAPLQGVDVKYILSLVDGTATNKEGKLFYEYFFKNRFILHWGGLADPFCHVEKKHGIGYTLLRELADRKYPTLFSFKGPMILDDKYLQLFEHYKKQQSFAFQTSIVTADDELAKYVEPGVPSPTQRFKAMRALSDMGYYTILRMRPFIIGVTDLTLDELLQKGKDAGMSGISTELYAVDCRTNAWSRKQYAEMEKLIHVDSLLKYYSTLSPSERGGYMRLNIKVKERIYKTMYKFCSDNDIVLSISDPDGKSLGSSPCCCGLPEVNTRNKEFENFSTNQMTAAMIKARRLYHSTGELMKFHFHEVYGGFDDGGFLNDIELSHQNCGVSSHNYAYRKRLTQLLLLQRKWNNLRSSSNVASYFHNNIVPIGLSEDKLNLVYQYKPYDFEDSWAADGLDMTR